MVSLLSWAAADCRLFRRFNQRSPHDHVLVDGVHIKTGQGILSKDGAWYTVAGGDPLYCLPQDCLLVGNPEVGNSECINHQDCLP